MNTYAPKICNFLRYSLSNNSRARCLEGEFLREYVAYFENVYLRNVSVNLSVPCINAMNKSTFLESASKENFVRSNKNNNSKENTFLQFTSNPNT